MVEEADNSNMISEKVEVQSELVHRLRLAYLVYCQRCHRVLGMFGSLKTVSYSFTCNACGATSKMRLCHKSDPTNPKRRRIVVLSLHSALGIEVWRGLSQDEREKWLSLLK